MRPIELAMIATLGFTLVSLDAEGQRSSKTQRLGAWGSVAGRRRLLRHSSSGYCARRESAMRMCLLLLLAATFALSSLDGATEEKQIADVKELAGTWQGLVTREEGQERTTLIVSADGSYRALTIDGAITEGKFYLQDGKLRYRSSRTTGSATLSEDQGKTLLKVMPENVYYKTGTAEYERVK